MNWKNLNSKVLESVAEFLEIQRVLLHLVKIFLKDQGIEQDTNPILFDTDLVSYGIESIVLLTMLTSLEKEFRVSISLDQLEKKCFVFSVDCLEEASYVV